MKHIRPKQFFGILAAILIAGGTFAASWYQGIGLLTAYLASLNILTFFIYGFDKRRAIAQKGRVPEVVLHLLAFAGGSVAAFCGQIIFRHKTRKRSFRLIFAGIVFVQIIGLGLWFYFNNAR